MEIIRSNVLGFCMGVSRAVALANEEADRAAGSGGQTYTLGPLIHNPDVLQELKDKGVQDTLPQDVCNCSVIIRAHGVAPSVEEDLRKRGAKIIDATCPNVKESQLRATALVNAGFHLFLAGDANHAEIAGIVGYANEQCVVVSNQKDAEIAAKNLFNKKEASEIKTALMGQTTISEDEYFGIAEAIKKYFPNLSVLETICNATKERQEALRELLDNVDSVLVVGGKDSANTKRLFTIAQESQKPCALIENASEIPPVFYSCNKVGLCTGASTPETVIGEIELELLR